jgi:hypothetical protein
VCYDSDVTVEDRARLDGAGLAEIEAAVALHRTLEDVVRWGLAHRPALVIAAVVTQDEFTHDVVVPFRNVWLVYDTT